MALNAHTCPGGCGRRVAHHLYACPACWRRLPHDLRMPILTNHGRDRAAHWAAMADAGRWYRENPLPEPLYDLGIGPAFISIGETEAGDG